MKLIIDVREKALCTSLHGVIQYEVEQLPLGDIKCEYDNGGLWIAERKTARDLADSIRTRRWSEQSARLSQVGCESFYIIEGDLRYVIGVPYEAMMSALLNAELRPKTHVIRSVDVIETATVVQYLVRKGENPVSIPTGIAPNASLTKRKRDADPDLVFMRQLMCIPTISENIAKHLKLEFGKLTSLQNALRNKETFPNISLDEKHTLGKKRIETLCNYLL